MAAKKKTAGTKKASTTKPASKAGAKASGRKLPDPQKVRETAVKSVLQHGPQITQAVIKEAEKGSHTVMKSLFEFAGIWQPLAEENLEAAKGARSSLAELLLDAVNNSANESNPQTGKETSAG